MSAKKAQLSSRLREILSALVPKGHRKLASYEVAGKSSKKNLRIPNPQRRGRGISVEPKSKNKFNPIRTTYSDDVAPDGALIFLT
jgi:hypothetical protein